MRYLFFMNNSNCFMLDYMYFPDLPCQKIYHIYIYIYIYIYTCSSPPLQNSSSYLSERVSPRLQFSVRSHLTLKLPDLTLCFLPSIDIFYLNKEMDQQNISLNSSYVIKEEQRANQLRENQLILFNSLESWSNY